MKDIKREREYGCGWNGTKREREYPPRMCDQVYPNLKICLPIHYSLTLLSKNRPPSSSPPLFLSALHIFGGGPSQKINAAVRIIIRTTTVHFATIHLVCDVIIIPIHRNINMQHRSKAMLRCYVDWCNWNRNYSVI